jgi:hypothetical protein
VSNLKDKPMLSLHGGNRMSKLNQSQMSASDSIDTGTKRGMRRTESGSSLISNVTNQFGNVLDASRIERLLQTFNLISASKKQNDLIKIALKEIKSLVSFNNCTIYVFSADLMKGLESVRPEIDGFHLSKAMVDNGRTISAVSESEEQSNLSFTKPEDIKHGLKT